MTKLPLPELGALRGAGISRRAYHGEQRAAWPTADGHESSRRATLQMIRNLVPVKRLVRRRNLPAWSPTCRVRKRALLRVRADDRCGYLA